jgi:hypothetical protein
MIERGAPDVPWSCEIFGDPQARHLHARKGMPNKNNNQKSQNHPQKQANRDREQQHVERIPQRGDDQPVEQAPPGTDADRE